MCHLYVQFLDFFFFLYFLLHTRPHDATIAVSLACGSLSGIASSTGE